MNVMPATNKAAEDRRAIGWNGKTLVEMITESERLFAETGRYWGIEDLSIKDNDPIKYEKIWSRLRGGLVGARETALNISASPIVREIGELCFGLYTPEGDSISLSTGIMAHIHTMSEALKHIVRTDYESNPGIEDGDIFVNNDPQLGDVHNADVQEFVPIFWEGELVAWAAGVTHEIDVGAPQPCGMPVGTVNRYEDGFILSCEKVGSQDRLHRDYERRSESATRMPFYWVLDEKCRIAGCHMIRNTVLRLIEEEGIETFKTFTREVIEDTRHAFVNRIKEMLIPGVYRSPSFMDIPHAGDKGAMPDYAAVDSLMNCPLELKIDAEGSFDIDIDGANKWGYHSFNCTPSGIQGGLWVTLCQTLIPNDKVNDGAYLATTFNTPYGTWANPDNLSVSNTLSWMFLIPCFTGLVHSLNRGFCGRGYLEEIIAAYPFTGNISQGGGINHHGHDGSWSNFEHSCSGVSARWAWDGETSCAAVWNPEGDMGDVEAWEIIEPLIYLGRNIRPNSGGLGKFRGGSAFECVRMVFGTESQLLYHARDGHVHQCSGIFGGYPGSTGYRHTIKNTDMKERIAKGLPYPVQDVDSENSEISANINADETRNRNLYHFPDPHKEYDLYLSQICGGHGLGDVLDRVADSVSEDINTGHLLERYAGAHGVIGGRGENGTWSVDTAATEARRVEMRKKRLDQSQSVEEWMDSQRARVTALDFNIPVTKMHRESCELSEKWLTNFRAFWDLGDDWHPQPE